jgi:hypothetical protein
MTSLRQQQGQLLESCAPIENPKSKIENWLLPLAPQGGLSAGDEHCNEFINLCQQVLCSRFIDKLRAHRELDPESRFITFFFSNRELVSERGW